MRRAAACAALLLLHPRSAPAQATNGSWSFSAGAAPDLQARLFGTALAQRWFGADLALSVPLGPGRHLWTFGDSFVGERRSGGALCSGVAAARCAMVPQTVALSTADRPALAFSWGRNASTQRPAPLVPVPEALQPRSVRGVHCPDCGCPLQPGAAPARYDCTAVPGQCCHAVDYLWLLAALAAPDGSQLIFLADIVRDNFTRADLGWCRGTMAVVVEDPRGPGPPAAFRRPQRFPWRVSMGALGA
jgi:hypothetical protein